MRDCRTEWASSSAQGIQRRLLQIGDVNGTQSLQVGIAAGKPSDLGAGLALEGIAEALAVLIPLLAQRADAPRIP